MRSPTAGTKTVKVTVTDGDGATKSRRPRSRSRTSTPRPGGSSSTGPSRRCGASRRSLFASVDGRGVRRDRGGRLGPRRQRELRDRRWDERAAQPHVHDHGRPHGRRARRGRPRRDGHEDRARSTWSTRRRWRRSAARGCSTSARPGPTRTPPRTTARSSPAHGTSTTTASSTTAPGATVQVTAAGTTGWKDLRLKRHRQRGRDRDRHRQITVRTARPDRDLRPRAAALPGGGTVHRRHDHRPDLGRRPRSRSRSARSASSRTAACRWTSTC